MLTLVHEYGLSYTTLSEVLSSLSVGTDRYGEIFSTTIAVKYGCQRCHWKQFDEPESVVVLDNPLLECFAPQARETCSRKKARDDGICGGTITGQRQFPEGIAKILWIEGPMSNLEPQDYDDRGFLTGCLETGLYWRRIGSVLYQHNDDDKSITARNDGQGGWIHSPDFRRQSQPLLYHVYMTPFHTMYT